MPTTGNATTPAEIEDTFAAVVRNAVFSGADLVLIEPYNGPRPLVAYATVYLVSAKGYEHEIRRFDRSPGGALTERIAGTHWVRVIIQFFGGDAFEMAVTARNKLKSAAREFDLFQKTGMGQIGEVTDVSEDYQARHERRARFTVDFYAMFSGDNPATEISKVGMTLHRNETDEIRFEVVNERERIDSYFYYYGDSVVLRKGLLNEVAGNAWYFLDGNSLIIRKAETTGQKDDGFFFLDTDTLFLRKETLEGVGT